MTKTVLK